MNNKNLSFKSCNSKILSVILSITLATMMFGTNLTLNNVAFGETDNSAATEVSQTSASSSDEATTTIYFTNDIHGNFQNATSSNLCYATLKSLKKQASQNNNKCFLVDAGDHTSGSNYTNYDCGESAMEIIKNVGFDFRVPGNHEFDYGSEKFLNVFNKDNDYYACNYYNGTPTQRGQNKLESYKVVTGANGEKIAFIGIMTPQTVSAAPPGYFQDKDGNWTSYIDNATQPTQDAIYNVINDTVSQIKNSEGQDTICIGVGHLGNDESAILDCIDSGTIVKKSKGLSAFIDGHSHTIINDYVTDADGKTVQLIQAASGLNDKDETETTGINRVGKFTINSSKQISGQILKKTDIEITQVTPDAEILEDEQTWLNEVDTALGQQIATNKIITDGSGDFQRTKCNNLADMVTDSKYYYANYAKDDTGVVQGADCAIMNAGGIRSSLATGDITLSSCMTVLPFNNNLVVSEITGHQLLDALEFGARLYPDKNAGLLHVAGCTYYINSDVESTVQVENNIWQGPPTGQYRVNGVKIYNKETHKFDDLDLNKVYKVAGIDYLLGNFGDGYAMFKGAVRHQYSSINDYRIFGKYLSEFALNTNISKVYPQIKSEASPLKLHSEYDNYPINYEELSGANRFKEGVYVPEPEPTPTPVPGKDNSEIQSVSSATGDNAIVTFYCLMVVMLGCGFVVIGSRHRAKCAKLHLGSCVK